MENKMEKSLNNEMATGNMLGFIGVLFGSPTSSHNVVSLDNSPLNKLY